MGESDADRQRRSRRHRAGDHALCIPGRCLHVTPGVTCDEPQVRGLREATLGAAGRQLWDDVTDGGKLPALHAVLLLEACRAVDRLEKLDAQLRGDDREWLRVERDGDDPDAEMVVIVDKALAEARQQQLALKQLLGEIRQVQRSGKGRPPVTPRGGGRLVSIRDRVQNARGDQAAG